MVRFARRKKMVIFGILLIAVLLVGVAGLGLHRKPHFISNFEEAEYGQEKPFIEPTSVKDGLAVYRLGSGVPVLLFPYPHGHTNTPMVHGALAAQLVEMGRQVITFDVPGAYRSTRQPSGDMEEMVRSADETMELLQISTPVDVVGHSMSGLAALGYAVERPNLVRRLVLVGSCSGFPAAARWGLPGSVYKIYEPDFWRIVFWGMRVNSGRADLALHKKLQNLMGKTAYVNLENFVPLPIADDDRDQGVPVRMIWSKNMYSRLSYADRLGEVSVPTLILTGRHDTYTPLPCAEELAAGITEAELVVFESSGHAPFVEEPLKFQQVAGRFLAGE